MVPSLDSLREWTPSLARALKHCGTASESVQQPEVPHSVVRPGTRVTYNPALRSATWNGPQHGLHSLERIEAGFKLHQWHIWEIMLCAMTMTLCMIQVEGSFYAKLVGTLAFSASGLPVALARCHSS